MRIRKTSSIYLSGHFSQIFFSLFCTLNFKVTQVQRLKINTASSWISGELLHMPEQKLLSSGLKFSKD